MTEQIKSTALKVGTRLTSEISPDFKPIKTVGAILAVAGITIKIVAVFTPAMPVALVSLAPEIIGIGLAFWGSANYSKNTKKELSGENISVIDGKTGWKKAFAIVKNLL
jgi:hypothetical protein